MRRIFCADVFNCLLPLWSMFWFGQYSLVATNTSEMTYTPSLTDFNEPCITMMLTRPGNAMPRVQTGRLRPQNCPQGFINILLTNFSSVIAVRQKTACSYGMRKWYWPNAVIDSSSNLFFPLADCDNHFHRSQYAWNDEADSQKKIITL